MAPDLLTEFEAPGGVPVSLWSWPDTGFSVVLARASGPITHAYFCIATEALDDDGLPHTLEHLVFLGSEKFPYKGVLDMAANRLFARGTNAWTATDHTAYTATHAGAEGLLSLLPVYADHVLFPTLTPSGYLTEVHHVDGEGADAGVVYCEMQGRENTGYSRSSSALDRLLFPFGTCGYASETGGRLQELRDSCSHAKVAAYHRRYYRPSGVRLIVAGDVDPQALLAALEPVQASIRAKGASFWPPAPERPWATPAPPLAASARADVAFPSDDEATGIVRVAWLTFPFADLYRRAAMEVLLVYLTDTSVSELQRAFVECDPPLAGGVYPSTSDYQPAVAGFAFDSVPTEQLGAVTAKLSAVLSDFGAGRAALDAKRLQSVLHRQRLDVLDAAERSPGDAVANAAIPAFLYAPAGQDGAALRESLDALGRLTRLEAEPPAFWTALAQAALVEAPRADVVATPSAQLGRDMAAAEAARLAAQREALGPAKLKELGEALKNATEANNIPMPADALAAFPVPPVDKVRLHAVATLRSAATPAAAAGAESPLPAPPAALAALAAAVSALPLPAQFDDVASAFVNVALLLRTDALSPRQLALLPTLLALVFESPVRRGAALVPHDVVVAELADATLSTHAALGFGGGRFSVGSFGEGVVKVGARAEAGRYADAVRLLADCVLRGEATPDRVRVQLSKALNAVPRAARDGGTCAAALLRSRISAPGSASRATAFVKQQRVLKHLLLRLDADPAAVCAELEAVRAALLAAPNGVMIHAAGRLTDLAAPDATQPWRDALLPGLEAARKAQAPALPGRVASAAAALAPQAQTGGWAAVAANSAVESGFLSASAPGPQGWHGEELAALMVATEMLTQLEGPFWKEIRGLGLAYSYSLTPVPEEGLITFTLFKASHVAKAYATAAGIVKAYAAAEADSPLFAAAAVETAVSSAIFAVLNREATPADAGAQALLSYLRCTGSAYSSRLVQQLRRVRPSDVSAALRRYVAPLFDPATVNVAACVNPNKAQELAADFKAQGGPLFLQLASIEDAFPAAADGEAAEAAPPCVAGGRTDADGAGMPAEGCECPRCVRGKAPFKLA